MQIRFLLSHFQSGVYNMALDEVLLNSVHSGSSLPILRFYGWNTPAISLGYFQKSGKQISLENCSKMGIDIVRRLTGGRAVLHDQELTYSVIFPEDFIGIPKTIHESYQYFSSALVKGFQSLGINAELAIESSVKPSTFSSAACFDAPSSYEVMVSGKKIVGSAQTRQKGIILQHGSILNSLDINKLFRCFDISDHAFEKLTADFRKKATSIEDELGYHLPWNHLVQAFKTGFSSALNFNLIEDELTPLEISQVNILSQKYSSNDWTFRK